MIEFNTERADNVVAVRIEGRLTDHDYKTTLIPTFEKLFAERGRLRVMIHFDKGFEGWDFEAAWDDTVFGLHHRADFEKIAIVGGPNWIDWCVKASVFLMKGEVRTFPADHLDAACAWLTA